MDDAADSAGDRVEDVKRRVSPAKERLVEGAKEARSTAESRASEARESVSKTAAGARERFNDARETATDKLETAEDRARAATADLSGENDGFMKGYPRVTAAEKSVVSIASSGLGLGFRAGRFVLSKVGLDERAGSAIRYIRDTSANTFETVGVLRSTKETAEQYWPVRLAERMIGGVDANVREQLAS